MKNYYLFLLFILIKSYVASAQNYSPIVSGNTSLFEDNSTYLAALHIDSTTSDAKGTAYHFLKTWQPYGSGCLDYHNATWPGAKCIKNNNTYYFFNVNLDTIYFESLTEVNDSWIFYKYTNGDYIEATVTAKDQKKFLGLTDSVKTISLQRKDLNGNNLYSNMNGSFLEISKYYGFTDVLGFSTFPNLSAPLPNTHGRLKLVGLTSPQVGTQLITSNDIFNYDIGDVFHYDSLYYSSTNIYQNNRQEKSICTILGKNISTNTDTVTYKIARVSDIEIFNGQTHVQTNIYGKKDTIIEKHVLNEPLHYPEQAIPTFNPSLSMERRPFPMYRLMHNGTYTNRLQFYPSYYFPFYDGQCWSARAIDPTPTFIYAEGLGLVEYNENPFDEIRNQDYKRLVYYKKGSETWGAPLVLSIYSQIEDKSFLLFPNPLKQGESLHYKLGDFQVTEVSIYNSTGNKVLKPSFTAYTVDVSSFPCGLYVIQFLNDKNEFVSNKFIIR